MTIRISAAQAECLQKMRRGLKTCPPLIYKVVVALIKAGYVYETRVGGSVYYFMTEKGKDFR